MDILYLLIPFSALLVLGLLALFNWAVNSGQFEDLEREGQRILAEPAASVDDPQGVSSAPVEQ